MNNNVLRGSFAAIVAAQFGCAQQFGDVVKDIGVQPRFNVGTQYYEYNQEARLASPEQFSNPASKTLARTSSKLTFSDVMPLINGGVTLFKDKFSLDFDAQYAFNGSSMSSYSNRAYLPQGYRNLPAFQNNSGVVTSSGDIDTPFFDRTEYSMTLGYQLTEHLLVFAGYKRAYTNFSLDRMTGRVDAVDPATGNTIGLSTGNFTGSTQICLDYEGAFVGAKTAWPFAHGSLDGLLTGHFGVAFLEGSQTLSGSVRLKRDGGGENPLSTEAFGIRTNLSGFEGNSIGWVLGVGWRGATSLPALSYSAGVNAYQYTFTAKEASDISEMAVRFDMGLAYSFDF